ncbi:MAG: hypothetical protein KAT65_27505, partial [Methanophagales archaeon]|nr:hypothetical protein [Methanophagales archaeon]
MVEFGLYVQTPRSTSQPTMQIFGRCRFAMVQLILRSRKSGVGGVERMPCAYFEGKNREMKAKKEREGLFQR